MIFDDDYFDDDFESANVIDWDDENDFGPADLLEDFEWEPVDDNF